MEQHNIDSYAAGIAANPMAAFMPDVRNPGQSDVIFGADFAKTIEKLIKDPESDKRLKDSPLWAVTTQSFKLTFFDQTDVFFLEHLFEASVCAYMRSISPEKFDANQHILIQQLRFIFYSNVKRAVGTAEGRMNERKALISQFRQLTTVSSGGGSGNRGILKKLLGF